MTEFTCCHEPTDVFYGTDLYGRGTFGGGEFTTNLALQALSDYPFSLAFFGIGYLHEIDPLIASERFWTGLNI